MGDELLYAQYIIMASTRFHDDPCRIRKQLQQMTDPGRWALDVPGNGAAPCFQMDPQIIPQKWGANVWTNCTDVQSYLLGLDQRLGCNKPVSNKYMQDARPIEYPTCESLTTDQPRTTNPAWELRGVNQSRWGFLHENPQKNTEIAFQHNVSTRLRQKDNFVRRFDCT